MELVVHFAKIIAHVSIVIIIINFIVLILNAYFAHQSNIQLEQPLI